jgi:type I restriction enzyme R subunit
MRSDQLGAINKLCGRPLAEFLDSLQVAKDNTILFTGGDALLGVSTGGEAPADYLKSFEAFLRENMNKVPALLVVAKRPRDLTRAELRKLKLALSEAGFSEAGVRAAWRNAKNEDVAASIIGFIRGLALGSPIKSYSARVDGALLRVAEQHNFKDTQRRWLQRIGDQMKAETVVDREALDSDQFKQEGGFRRIDRVFEGQLEAVLGEIADEVWKDAV